MTKHTPLFALTLTCLAIICQHQLLCHQHRLQLCLSLLFFLHLQLLCPSFAVSLRLMPFDPLATSATHQRVSLRPDTFPILFNESIYAPDSPTLHSKTLALAHNSPVAGHLGTGIEQSSWFANLQLPRPSRQHSPICCLMRHMSEIQSNSCPPFQSPQAIAYPLLPLILNHMASYRTSPTFVWIQRYTCYHQPIH